MIKQTGVRQYVGARYVPLICGEWNPDIDYEPLSIVTYFGNSYTSKVPVPAGTLPTDTAYWAKTGNFNAQLEDITKRVEYLEDNRAGECIFIGDDLFNSSLSTMLSDIQIKLSRWYSSCNALLLPGYGFSKDNPKNMLSWLSSYQTLNPKKITAICCFMGINDYNSVLNGATYTTIIQGIQEFVDQSKVKFPNAQIIIGFTGYNLVNIDISNGVNSVYKGSVLNGGKSCTLQGVFINLKNWTNGTFNAEGFNALEDAIMLNVLSSYTEINTSYNATVTGLDANVESIGNEILFYAYIRKDMIIGQFLSNYIKFRNPYKATDLYGQQHKICQFNNPAHHYSGWMASPSYYSTDNGTNYLPASAMVRYDAEGWCYYQLDENLNEDIMITNISWDYTIAHLLGGI